VPSRRPNSGVSGNPVDPGPAYQAEPDRRPGPGAGYLPEPEPQLDWSPAWREFGPDGSLGGTAGPEEDVWSGRPARRAGSRRPSRRRAGDPESPESPEAAESAAAPRPAAPRPAAPETGAPETGAPETGAPDAGIPRDPEAAARQVCLRLLTLAPRTRAQLADALRRRHVPDEAAEAVLDRFTEIGLIDDPAFARAWVESRHHGRGLSRRALASELQRRGVADEDVHEAIELIDDDQEAVMARQVIAGKVRGTRGQPFATRIRKLMGVLARKGYGAALAYRVVREALEAEGAHAAEIAAEIGEPDPDIGSDDCP
jgi:regulatory protein